MKTFKKGFTLIELLVVVAIISILSSILFPLFARARENARRSSCMSNLKQIGLAFQMYAQDYDGQYFGWSYGGSSVGGTGYNAFWAPINPSVYRWILEPYIKNTQIFYCPSRSKNQVGYGYNEILRGGMAESAIQNPSQMLAFVDDQFNGYLAYRPASANWRVNFCKTVNTTPCSVADSFYGKHLDGVNVAFVDGHVKWMRPVVLYNNGNNVPYYDGR